MATLQTSKLTEAFSALGDSTRFKMIELLGNNPDLCVSELAKLVGITTAGASQHLNILSLAGLVKPVRDGKRICYELSQDKTATTLYNLIRKGE